MAETSAPSTASSPPSLCFFAPEEKKPKKRPRTDMVTVHPLQEYDDFQDHPPVPLFNYIIDNKTGQIKEDRTGRP